MKKLIFFLAILFSSCTSNPNYKLAICAIFKNEASWIKEWIDYHHKVIGAEHFYLYDNESSDDFKKILKPYIENGLVELFDWDSSNPNHCLKGDFTDFPWAEAQLGAYNDCLKNQALGKAKWVAMIDVDEFIVPSNGVQSFYEILDRAEKRKKGTLSIRWKMFGTSHVPELKEGELLTEKLTFRGEDNHFLARNVKSIHRPEAIDFCHIHIAEKLKNGFGAKLIKMDQVAIHHYWTRTENFGKKKRNIDEKTFESLNRIEDRTILQYLPKYKL